MRRFIRFIFLLVCLSSLTLLPGCAVELTASRLQGRNSESIYRIVCRRTPDIPDGVRYWAVNTKTGEVVTDRDPEQLFEFARVADRIYEYEPNAPAATVDQLIYPYNHLSCGSGLHVTEPPRKSLPKNELYVPHAYRQALGEVLADSCSIPPPEPVSMGHGREHIGQILTTPPMPNLFDPETGKMRDILSPTQKAILKEVVIRAVFEGGPVTDDMLSKGADGKPYKWWRDPEHIAQPQVQAVAGFVSGVAVGAVPGGAMGSDLLIQTRVLPEGTRDARIGKALGEMAVSTGTLFVSVGGAAAGAGMIATGGGAVPGTLLCLGSITLAASSATTFCHGAKEFTLELLFKRDDTPETVTPIPAPPPPKPAAAPPPAAAQPPAAKPTPSPAAKPAQPAPQPTSKAPPNAKVKTNPTTGTTTKTWTKCTGQWHHTISKRIHDALEKHPLLRGVYKRRDNRFVTQAIDKKAHNGYQKWHKKLDDEIAAWIDKYQKATPKDFEAELRRRYAEKDLKDIFPNGF
jgi:hypothetical protein